MIANKQTCHYSETETFDATLPILFLTQTNYSMLWYDKTSFPNIVLVFYRAYEIMRIFSCFLDISNTMLKCQSN